jgi:class 3 adenylate cyclase/putative methionine-R-sulfoxide reductase with GAF domain
LASYLEFFSAETRLSAVESLFAKVAGPGRTFAPVSNAPGCDVREVGSSPFFPKAYYSDTIKIVTSWSRIVVDASPFTEEIGQLKSMIEAAGLIVSQLDLNSLLKILILKTAEVTRAERATLFLIDKEKSDLFSRVFVGDEVQELRCPMGKGLAGTVAETGKILNIVDAYRDSRFNPEVDRQTGYVTKSILTMPLRNLEGVIVGVVQSLNKVDGNAFNEHDVEMLEGFSSLMAISLENAINFQRLKATMAAFQYFVPSKYLDRISRDGIEKIKVGYAEQTFATILFLDIRNFTGIAETMTATEIARFLNGYFASINPLITSHGGVIDKFLGDGFMAIFDLDSADSAVNAALAIVNHLKLFNARRADQGLAPIRIGIGLSSGDVTIGTVGSADRMDTTCIGNAANAAKRIEALNKTYGTTLLIGHSTFYRIKQSDEFHIREIDSILVRGQSVPEVIYEVFTDDEEGTFHKKTASYPDLLEGMTYYKFQDWNTAIVCFTKAVQAFSEDTVAKLYLERCLFLMRNPPGQDWNGAVNSANWHSLMEY